VEADGSEDVKHQVRSRTGGFTPLVPHPWIRTLVPHPGCASVAWRHPGMTPAPPRGRGRIDIVHRRRHRLPRRL